LYTISNNFTILDIPAGTGRAMAYLKDNPCTIIGCDLTNSMLQFAKEKCSGNCIGLLQGDASKLPFHDGKFDCVLTLNFFHLFPPYLRKIFVHEFDRILKPGGFFLCSFTNGWYGFGLNWIRKLIGNFPIYFLMPGEIKRLFPGWRVHALHGNYLPLQSFVGKFRVSAEATALWMTGKPPLNRFCFTRFYLLQKPN
jgi:SAM-dependent methyltransferase